MSETVTPPPGFSLVPPPASDASTPPPGFTLVGGATPPESTHPEGEARTAELHRELAPKPRTQMEDIQQGVAHGLVQGSASVLGLPADVWHLLKSSNKWALTKTAELAGLISPEEGQKLREGKAPDHDPFGSTWITQHVQNLAKSAGRDVSPPQTTAGQYAETGASFVPMAAAVPFMGGAAAGQAARQVPAAVARYGVFPAATSETAGQLTKGTAAEPYARVAGAIGPEAAWQGLRFAGRAMNPTTRMMEGVTPADEAGAQARLVASRAAGAPLTSAEAVLQETGGASRVGDIQRVVEQTPEGAAIMRPFMAERPAQTEALGRSTFDQITPAGVDPYQVPPKVQAASDAGVSEANAARTAAVDPLYKAAATDKVPVADMESFLTRIDRMIASDKTGIMGPELAQLRARLTETAGKPRVPAQRIPTTTPTGATIYKTVPAVPPTPRVPVTDIENLDRARKFFRDRLSLPQWAQNATSKEEGAKIQSLLGELRQKMVSSSPDFAAGKTLYQNITENTFTPLVLSPTGQLAAAETFPKQAAILFNPNPLPGSERAIGQAVRQVAKVDEDAAAQLVRMHLEKTFNEATQSNIPGANQWGGPKFAATVMGNPQQAKNLEAVIRALPKGDLKWRAFRNGMDILEGMGKRQYVGSQTAFNSWIRNEMEHGNPGMEALVAAASPGQWPSLVTRIYRRITFDRKTAELARAFTEGSVADLKRIAQAGRRSFQGQAAMIGALARQGAVTTPETREARP